MDSLGGERDLAESLALFDRVAINVDNLLAVVSEMEPFTVFSGNHTTASHPRYEQLLRDWAELVCGLPPIDDFTVDVTPISLPDLGQWRIDAIEVPESLSALNEVLEAPRLAVGEYRHRLQRARRRLIRRRAEQLIAQIDGLLAGLTECHPRDAGPLVEDEDWLTLIASVRELLALLGSSELSGGRVNDLMRHLHFGHSVDAHDIAEFDWPDVKPRIFAALYDDREPLPVENVDLAALADGSSSTRVPTELDFSVLDDAQFERLIYTLLASTDGYENASWQMETRAPDRAPIWQLNASLPSRSAQAAVSESSSNAKLGGDP